MEGSGKAVQGWAFVNAVMNISGSVKDLPKRRYVKQSRHGAVSTALQRVFVCALTAHVETEGVEKVTLEFPLSTP